VSTTEAVTLLAIQVGSEVENAYNLVDKGGVVALLFLGIIFVFCAFTWGWVVPGYVYKASVENARGWEQHSNGIVEAVKSLTLEVRESNRESGRSGRR
jgi:hypothetical protein